MSSAPPHIYEWPCQCDSHEAEGKRKSHTSKIDMSTHRTTPIMISHSLDTEWQAMNDLARLCCQLLCLHFITMALHSTLTKAVNNTEKSGTPPAAEPFTITTVLCSFSSSSSG